MQFDIVLFVQEHDQDNVDKFNRLSNMFFTADKSLVAPLFKKVFEAASVLYTEGLSEEALCFFPQFLLLNQEFVNADLISPIFTLLVTKYCSPEQQMLCEVSLRSGIEIVKRHGKAHGQVIVACLEKFLKNSQVKSENQIASLIFLGVASPFITNKQIIDGVAKKITNLILAD